MLMIGCFEIWGGPVAKRSAGVREARIIPQTGRAAELAEWPIRHIG
jgi:hypothetical protein